MEEFEEGRGDPLKKHSSQDKYGTGRREEVVEDVGKREQYWIGLWLFGAIYLPSGRALIINPLDRPI